MSTADYWICSVCGRGVSRQPQHKDLRVRAAVGWDHTRCHTPAPHPTVKSTTGDRVTAIRDVLPVALLSDSVTEHRADYWTWVQDHAELHIRRPLLDLRDEWCRNNGAFFGGRMMEPYITLTEPSAPQIFGQCCPVSSWGSRLEIRLRPSLLDGTHPRMSADPCHEPGRIQFVKDVLLHEMIHQHVMEHQPSIDESSYHGHGPVFTDHANRIGALLGLAEVIVRNRSGEKHPTSGSWPHGVAPADRYHGAYRPKRRVTARTAVVPVKYLPEAIAAAEDRIEIDFGPLYGDGHEPTFRVRLDVDAAVDLMRLLTGFFGDDDGDDQ